MRKAFAIHESKEESLICVFECLEDAKYFIANNNNPSLLDLYLVDVAIFDAGEQPIIQTKFVQNFRISKEEGVVRLSILEIDVWSYELPELNAKSWKIERAGQLISMSRAEIESITDEQIMEL